ncbi:hypothetical protein BerOc1_02972 [Pseudodesulfovibrio hydrargyri]|uniref:DUF2730 family protein n=1 Tax=Pseudodesulfovibrio hydrargyri TaxID=2125990 RepID=A0A1J5N5Y4_9BACT|nr:DUF2730 family protein [Pseudodesulfovibrio hydrargyri]OIQ51027.1 hypothetical protein BerOc1_02972 [Pseudodesulfovibrio hydrargyri]
MELHHIDLALRIVQVVVLPIVGMLLKLLLDQRRQLAELDRRITTAEACLKNVPSEEALHDLALTIRGFGGDLRVAVEKIEGMGRIVGRLEKVVTRHEDYMLNGGK